MKLTFGYSFAAAFTCALAAGVALAPAEAEACGCTTPPIPEPDALDFAVNQRAEQIIFEVDEEANTVSAHVLIRYAGSPAEFAWLVPVPNVPALALSETYAFGVLDASTRPQVNASWNNACPVQQYYCAAHSPIFCGQGTDSGALTSGGSSAGSSDGSDTAGGTGGGEPPPGVDVLDENVIGDYDTVTFAAADSALAIQWLQDNGFIVNDTIAPYMQSYIDENMVFVAAKLVAGAETDGIRPLQITYSGDTPMIPLRLTAVAAEPHMTVTTWIFGDQPYEARNLPDIMLAGNDVSLDETGRNNYPMLMARVIDEAGGRGFVREWYSDTFALPDGDSECCGGSDWCGVGGDDLCQCPNSAFDQSDCAATPGLFEGRALLQQIMERNQKVTRLTTRLSPEEMTFDPEFEPTPRPVAVNGALSLFGTRNDLSACVSDILDPAAYAALDVAASCATTYCGEGTCVAVQGAAACQCDAGSVARTFTDLDGEESVTCVPEQTQVDLGQGLALPDVCLGVDCGAGSCVALNGFPACACNDGAAARAEFGGPTAYCVAITASSMGPGGKNESAAIADLDVCAVVPPTCGNDEWLESTGAPGPKGVACEGTTPDPSDFDVPPAPTCDSAGGDSAGLQESTSSCACASNNSGGVWWLLAPLVLGFRRLRRRA